MSLSLAHPAPLPASLSKQGAGLWQPSSLRVLLLAGCLAAVAAAFWLCEPSSSVKVEPDLALLLRGMAMIKACIVMASVGVLVWRLGHPVPRRMAAAYLAGAWLIAGATTLVWQLSFLPLAAIVFHVGEFLILFTAWRDRGSKTPRLHTAA